MPSAPKLPAAQQSRLFDRWVEGVPVARLSRDFGISPCRIRTAVAKEANVRKEANTEERMEAFLVDCVTPDLRTYKVDKYPIPWEELYACFSKWNKEAHPRWKVPSEGEFIHYLLNKVLYLTPFASRHYLGRP